MTERACSRYTGYRFPSAIISHAVWLYFRFPLSLRMVEEMLAARGIVISHETVRQWALKFGQGFANEIRRRLPRVGDKWHLDKVVILSANSGGFCQSGEACNARLGARPTVQPVHDP
jgi:putative transposase